MGEEHLTRAKLWGHRGGLTGQRVEVRGEEDVICLLRQLGCDVAQECKRCLQGLLAPLLPAGDGGKDLLCRRVHELRCKRVTRRHVGRGKEGHEVRVEGGSALDKARALQPPVWEAEVWPLARDGLEALVCHNAAHHGICEALCVQTVLGVGLRNDLLQQLVKMRGGVCTTAPLLLLLLLLLLWLLLLLLLLLLLVLVLLLLREGSDGGGWQVGSQPRLWG